MKTKLQGMTVAFAFTLFLAACGESGSSSSTDVSANLPAQKGGQSAVQDADSKPDVVKVAVSSPDHTTLVAALKAADYVDALSNAGPFTVFAPVNAAFDALPAGTVDNLLKKENQMDLRSVLEYHVYVGVLKPDLLQDGQVLGMVSGENATISKQGEEIKINGATVKGVVEATNGIIYIIDQVLLAKK